MRGEFLGFVDVIFEYFRGILDGVLGFQKVENCESGERLNLRKIISNFLKFKRFLVLNIKNLKCAKNLKFQRNLCLNAPNEDEWNWKN